eukprot:NODE_3445_length_893_cov_62.090078_g3423_i0.p1 GENE.NODE_3445_length_893_cov_62.090078_g3423_i0~~NODE_3445_length_893_cov_62.090078_g3423_i0.p1  ORF type:complete len:270 (-),score=76.91 NODE_3445_length_893_cov_62.090078_g3423_i0:83-808(-)
MAELNATITALETRVELLQRPSDNESFHMRLIREQDARHAEQKAGLAPSKATVGPNAQMEPLITDLRSALRKRDDQLAQLQPMYTRVKAQFEALEVQYATLKESHARLQRDSFAELAATRQQHAAEIAERDNATAAAENAIVKQLAAYRTQADATLEETKNQLSDARNQSRQLAQQLEESQQTVRQLQTEMQQAQRGHAAELDRRDCTTMAFASQMQDLERAHDFHQRMVNKTLLEARRRR